MPLNSTGLSPLEVGRRAIRAQERERAAPQGQRGPWPKSKMIRWVTVYTDAGWKEGYAQVGCIARGGVAPYWLTGTGSGSCTSSTAAEAIAVLHALRYVGAHFSPPGGLEGFFVRSDNLSVVEMLQRYFDKSVRGRGEVRRELVLRRGFGELSDTRLALSFIFELCHERGYEVQAKHVRAHGREPDRVRRWMNERADRLGNLRSASLESPEGVQPVLGTCPECQRRFRTSGGLSDHCRDVHGALAPGVRVPRPDDLLCRVEAVSSKDGADVLKREWLELLGVVHEHRRSSGVRGSASPLVRAARDLERALSLLKVRRKVVPVNEQADSPCGEWGSAGRSFG